jgi:hypothetical protein
MSLTAAAGPMPSHSAHHRLRVEDLSPDQRAVYDGVMSWLRHGTRGGVVTGSKQILTLGGFGGTGKTAVVSVLAHELLRLGPLAFCAFTGRASSVLGRKLAESGIATVGRTVKVGDGGVRSSRGPTAGRSTGSSTGRATGA